MPTKDTPEGEAELHKRLVEISSSYGGYVMPQHKDMWAAMFRAIETATAAHQSKRLQALREELHGGLPEKRKDINPSYHIRVCSPQQRENRGFNRGLEQAHQAIDKVLGDG